MSDHTFAREPFLHPLHAIILAFPVALFSGALGSDITYLNTAVIMWSNFSAWMIAGALIFASVALAWAVVMVFRRGSAGVRVRARIYLTIVAIMWVAGLINAFQHSRDGWSSVGTLGLVLSIACTILALLAGWTGYSSARVRETAS